MTTPDFQWIDCNDRENSVLSFLRQTADGKNPILVVILNLTPVPLGPKSIASACRAAGNGRKP